MLQLLYVREAKSSMLEVHHVSTSQDATTGVGLWEWAPPTEEEDRGAAAERVLLRPQVQVIPTVAVREAIGSVFLSPLHYRTPVPPQKL